MSEASHRHLPGRVAGALVWFCFLAGAFIVLYGISVLYFIQKSLSQ